MASTVVMYKESGVISGSRNDEYGKVKLFTITYSSVVFINGVKLYWGVLGWHINDIVQDEAHKSLYDAVSGMPTKLNTSKKSLKSSIEYALERIKDKEEIGIPFPQVVEHAINVVTIYSFKLWEINLLIS